MSVYTVAKAIVARFKAQVETPQALTDKVQHDNVSFDPPDDDLWVRVSLLFGDRRLVEFGNTTKRYRGHGVAVVSIFEPFGDGSKDSLELADVVVSAFQSVTAAEVKYGTPSVIQVGRSGAYWQTNVNCPFYADETS